MNEIVLQNLIGFDWDKWNFNKNQDKHKVSYLECEQIFFNFPLLLYDDTKHSSQEKRLYALDALGKTDNERLLFIVFTIRNNLIRIISARDMCKKERAIYEKNTNF
ncbi:MAG: hypothetical protein ACD_69C00280G0003 [uncultured bacterium]|nr:MAG: hypothetical protein ACD_69C00280G0003 [uncultured bacterium]